MIIERYYERPMQCYQLRGVCGLFGGLRGCYCVDFGGVWSVVSKRYQRKSRLIFMALEVCLVGIIANKRHKSLAEIGSI
jgi:hypothetical protein